MNDARRKNITKALGLIEEAKGILDQVLEKEQEFYNNAMARLEQDNNPVGLAKAALDSKNQIRYLQESIRHLERAS